MADKKDPPQETHPAKPVIVLFIISLVMSFVYMRVREYLGDHPTFASFLYTVWLFLKGQATFSEVVSSTDNDAIANIAIGLRIFSLAISVVLIGGIISTVRKLSIVREQLWKPLQPPKEIKYGVHAEPTEKVNPKWQKVLEHINSSSAGDWRLAILEADIMLDEVLDKMGYHGATVGDKLKSIEASDFTSLQDAWEAHKVRNQIAHEGSDFVINKPEAERVIKLFRKVFEEFEYI